MEEYRKPMNSCDENRLRIILYLDDELAGEELTAFESHLAVCAGCLAAVEAERRFLDALHSARPLYTAPPELRSRVEKVLEGLPDSPRPRGFWLRMRGFFERSMTGPMLQAATACALLALVVGGVWIERSRRSDPRSDFEATAVRLHELRLKGKLPLEMHSSSPAAVSTWITQRVPFKVTLPSYDEMPGSPLPYQLEGARRVSYRNDAASYIAFRTSGRPVSMITLPTTLAPPLRGRRVVMGKLAIFYDTMDGFHVITWSGPRSRLTYALVTDLEHPSQSCVLCHAGPGTRDRDLMHTLNQQ
jgi:anti-sigma factor (TIGR02949 family)